MTSGPPLAGRVALVTGGARGIGLACAQGLSAAGAGVLMAINLKAVFFVTQAVLPQMIRQQSGAIVSISSLAARVGGIAAGIDYSTSKAGVIGLTRSLARQYGPKGIRVNAVAPGVIDTEMTRPWPEEVRQDFIARTPLRRLGTAEDVARAVVFLAGPASEFITGATIDVNGGLYMS